MPSLGPSAHSSPSHLKRHDHIAFLCGCPDHWRRMVTRFTREGLANKERILYLHGLYLPQQIRALMSSSGVPSDRGERQRLVAMEPVTEFLLRDGFLDQEAALRRLNLEVEEAQSAGLDGLRLWVDMNWVSYRAGGMAAMLECERLLNQRFLREHSCLVVCHYERVLFSPDTIKLIKHNHALVMDGYNFAPGLPQEATRAAAREKSPLPILLQPERRARKQFGLQS